MGKKRGRQQEEEEEEEEQAAAIAMMGAMDETEMEEDEDAMEAAGMESDGSSYDDEEEEEGEEGEDEEEDEEEAGAAAATAGQKRPRGGGDPRFAPPTEEEMRQLREAEGLFKSNLLRMEIAELVAGIVAPTVTAITTTASKKQQKQQKNLQGFLFALRDALLALPEGTMPETPSFHPAAFPFTPHAQWGKQGRGQLAFAPPTTVDVVGSFMLPGTMGRPDPTVDVAVTIPSSTFGPKWPFLNRRYHNRRNAYLSHLTRQLLEGTAEHLIKSVEVVSFQGDPNRPVLLLEPTADTGGVRVRLLPAICFSEKSGPSSADLKRRKKHDREQGSGGSGKKEEGEGEEAEALLDKRKLHPRRSNVRRQTHTDSGPEPLTPHYSQGILLEGAHQQHLAILHSALGCHAGQESVGKGVREALLLLKVWIAQQEGTLAAPDSLSGFGLACLAAYLLQERRLTLRMETLPALMVTLQFLADRPLTSTSADPLLLLPSPSSSPFDLSAYKGAFPCALIVAETGCNAFSGVSSSAAIALQKAAQAAVAALQANARDAVHGLFLTRRPFLQAYDYYVRLPLASSSTSSTDALAVAAAKAEEAAACDLPLGQAVARKACEVLTRALGNRARRIRCLHRPRRHAIYGTPPPLLRSTQEQEGEEAVWVGVGVDPQHALRLVDRGPAADDAAKAKEFRAFWGPKAELRRFKDGAIVEAVVWSTGALPRHRIVEDVMRHSLGHHLSHRFSSSTPQTAPAASSSNGNGTKGSEKGKREALMVLGNDLDPLLDFSSANAGAAKAAGGSMEPEALTKGALAALESLTEKLKGVKGLPLELQIVEPLSPALRHTSLFPPLPHPLLHGSGRHLRTLEGQQVTSAIDPLPIHLRFENSSKWPDDFGALKSAQTAFLMQLQRGLERDAEVKASLAGANALDLMLEGHAFRASIALPKEVTLLREAWAAAKDGTLDPKERASLPPVEEVEALGRRVERGGVHHRLIQACHATNPLFGRVVRLAQIWAGNHLLHPQGHLPHEAIELIVASIFTQRGFVDPPGSALNGLLSFLSLLATHDWAGTPLVVDPHSQMSPEEHEAALQAFEASRAAKSTGTGDTGGPAMYIVAPYDRECDWRPSWTDSHTPERVVVDRITRLARASLAALLQWMEGAVKEEEGWKPALVPPALGSMEREGWRRGGFDMVVRFRPEWVGPLLSGPYEKGAAALEEARKGCKALRCGKLYKNLAGAQAQKRVLGFDPLAHYHARLLALYGQHLALPPFMSPLHRDALALTFRPRAFLPAPFAVLQTRACIPITPERTDGNAAAESSSSSSAPFVLPNVAEIASDLKALGEGVVEEVVVVGCC